ncbi:hypothetical protein ACTBAC_000227 [Vibrio parahaemolyticus]|uniref:hypothetical protein n=1 Tax=Vibrio parahaemolyticus TaxID=670 RepID=UPI0004211B20|nr:hypothetical protein [Vibrio parahaemolyticus]AKU57558.1 hypothetical protein FORC8_3998 [Vibrio parahaemolyticus]APE86617.1 Hypothetical protein FORC18_4004 [Vibrio parahaemolyticus]EGU9320202.1 hypothetical protein [Vibrio parahaemolyticus]HCE4763666.1 hypothetical protein [Vibrio parahaemolyticus]HCG8343340.1 hypothetical protein [Vibrio parahaemolyticus]
MALTKPSLKQKLETELKAQGFVLEGEFAMAGKFAEAIANAVVGEITRNAQVEVTSGSSAGLYKVT